MHVFSSVTQPDSAATSAGYTFQSESIFAERLRFLRQSRRSPKLGIREQLVRESLSADDRRQVFAKTGGRCHICGGVIEGNWAADYLDSHCVAGPHTLDNYLPAHPSCNNYRWFYGPEELQWILKLGVWLRNLIERKTTLGRRASHAFWKYECIRILRRKQLDHDANPQ
jgi:hypothetical protein